MSSSAAMLQARSPVAALSWPKVAHPLQMQGRSSVSVPEKKERTFGTAGATHWVSHLPKQKVRTPFLFKGHGDSKTQTSSQDPIFEGSQGAGLGIRSALRSELTQFANAFGESLYLSSSPYQGSVGRQKEAVGRRAWHELLSPPVGPFYPREGSPTNVDYRKNRVRTAYSILSTGGPRLTCPKQIVAPVSSF